MTFREVQRFRQPWMWAALMLPAVLVGWGVVQQVVLHRPWGDDPMPDAALVALWAVVGLGVPGLFLVARLQTEVRDGVLFVRFVPFQLRTRRFGRADLQRWEAVTYRPLLDYGGWGLRWRPGRGWAWNVSGDRGVLLHLANGRRILIGSQRADELAAALDGLR